MEREIVETEAVWRKAVGREEEEDPKHRHVSVRLMRNERVDGERLTGVEEGDYVVVLGATCRQRGTPGGGQMSRRMNMGNGCMRYRG